MANQRQHAWRLHRGVRCTFQELGNYCRLFSATLEALLPTKRRVWQTAHELGIDLHYVALEMQIDEVV